MVSESVLKVIMAKCTECNNPFRKERELDEDVCKDCKRLISLGLLKLKEHA